MIFSLPFLLAPRVKSAAVVGCTFWEYEQSLRAADFSITNITMERPGEAWDPDRLGFALATVRPEIVYICSPNNPTGHRLEATSLIGLATRFPSTTFVVDQTYAVFRDDWNQERLPRDGGPPNIVVVVSLSKLFCLPGLRIGVLACASRNLGAQFREGLGPVRLNALAIEYLPPLLQDVEYLRQTRILFKTEPEFLKTALEERTGWLQGLPSEAPFRLFRIRSGAPISARELADSLASDYGIRVCPGHVYGLEDCIRVRAGRRQDNQVLAEAIGSYAEGMTLDLDRTPYGPVP